MEWWRGAPIGPPPVSPCREVGERWRTSASWVLLGFVPRRAKDDQVDDAFHRRMVVGEDRGHLGDLANIAGFDAGLANCMDQRSGFLKRERIRKIRNRGRGAGGDYNAILESFSIDNIDIGKDVEHRR